MDSNSPRTHSEGQWSPPPRFQDINEIEPTAGSPPHSHASPVQLAPSPHGEQGYFTAPDVSEKESHFPGQPIFPTPDYSAPQVAEYPQYGYDGRPLSPSSHGGTTVMSPEMRPYSFKEHVDPVSRTGSVPPPPPPKDEPTVCGMRRRTFFIVIGFLIIFIVVLAIGLGVGLGLGLKKGDKGNANGKKADARCAEKPELCIGGALDAKYFSTQGAFNGSGIALAGESWNTGQRRIFTLYFQHWTGDIRFMQYTTDRKWVGGTKAQTIATDAKDGSPLSAVAFALNTTQYFHLFYVDKNNTLKQVTQTNVTDIWEPGPLSDVNLKVYDHPSVGLQACWKGNYYGDSDYTKFPTASGETNQQPFEERLGMNIWFATDETTFQQYAWYNGAEEWAPIQKWQGMNGHAGVGCYSWGEGTTTYAMQVSRSNTMEVWWKDTNTTTKSEEDHPINSWTNATKGAIGDVYPTTSLGFTTYFYAQMADRSFKGFNYTFQAENTTYVEKDAFTITDPAGPVKGLGGTHLSATAYAEKQGNTTLWDSLYVFYQTEGSDITAFTRPLKGGEWTKGSLTIPTE